MRRPTPFDLVHLDLAEGPPSPPPVRPGRGQVVVFWRGGVPMGHLVVESDTDHTRDDLANAVAAATHEAIAHDAAGRDPVPTPGDLTVGVVVPTCRRPERLAACLASLSALVQRPDEIVVVDNAPGDAATAGQVRAVCDRFDGVRYVAEPVPGVSRARNTGARVCSTEVVAFVDDDVTVHPGWLGPLCAAFGDPAVTVATGLVLPAALDTVAQVRFEMRYGFGRGYVPKTFGSAYFAATRRTGVPAWEVGGSGNMAVRRASFLSAGGFDTRFGPGGDGSGSCEDVALFHRVLAGGGTCRYEPRAAAFHHHRATDAALRSQLFAYMRGHAAFFLFDYATRRDTGSLRHLVARLPRAYAGAAWRLVRGERTLSPTLLAAELAGCLSGLLFFVRRHRSAAASPSGDAAVADTCRTGIRATAPTP